MDRLHRSMQVDIAVVCIQLLNPRKLCKARHLYSLLDLFLPPFLLSCTFATINANVMNNALKLPVITHQPFSVGYAKYHFTGKFHASFSHSLFRACRDVIVQLFVTNCHQ